MSEKQFTSNTTIGAAWYKVSEKGTTYLSVTVNPEILPLTITERHSLTLFEIPEKDRKSENSPGFRLVLSLKQ